MYEANHSLCEINIQDRYYKIINLIGQLKKIYIFVGRVDEPTLRVLENIKKIINQILIKPREGIIDLQLSSQDTALLISKFGDQYEDILNISNQSLQDVVAWDYVENMIELDDNITNIKDKTANMLGQVFDYLYLYVETLIQDPMDITQNVHKMTSLGHTFIDNKDNIIEYPINPYQSIDLTDVSTKEFIEIYEGHCIRCKQNNTNDVLISDYNIVNNTIYLVVFCDYLKSNTVKELIAPLDHASLYRFKFGHLIKYWPNFLLLTEKSMVDRIFDNCVNGHIIPVDKQYLGELKRKIDRNKDAINAIKFPPEYASSTNIQFDECGILEIVIHINYNIASDDYIDLVKIFDRFELNADVPFVKYKGDASKNAMHKIFRPIVEEKGVKRKMILEWISNVIVKKGKKDPDTGEEVEQEYHISGKGLSFKKFLYQKIYKGKDGKNKIKNKYSTVSFYKNGKIEFRCFWDENINANLDHVMAALTGLIPMVQKINEIEYQMSGINRTMTIKPPELGFMSNPHSNTRIAYINSIMQFDYGEELNYDKLNDFAEQFDMYVIVMRKNIVNEFNKETGKMEPRIKKNTSLYMRYKRISNYLHMIDVHKFIYDIVKKTKGIDRAQIIGLLKKTYEVPENVANQMYDGYVKYQETLEERKKKRHEGEESDVFSEKTEETEQYELDFVLGKKIKKQPGIDIKIHGPPPKKHEVEIDQKSKIFVMGVKGVEQLTFIHRFLKNMLKLSKVEDQFLKEYPKFKQVIRASNIGQNPVQDAMIYKLVQDKTDVDADALFDQLLSLEETIQPEEEEKDTEEIQPTESAPVTVALPKPKIEPMDYKKVTAPLDILKQADPSLFIGTNYARKCQHLRHPVAIDADTHKKTVAELKQKLKTNNTLIAKLPIKGNDPKRAELLATITDLQRKLDIYEHGVTYRNRHYFCPDLYANGRIVSMSDIIGEHDLEGNPVLRAPANYKYPYAGFTRQSVTITDTDGKEKIVCLPCCFAKPKARHGECVEGIVKEETDLSSQRYVLKDDKVAVEPNRFAALPEILTIIFNNGVHYDKKNPTLKLYLRKGVNQDTRDNAFLNAISDVFSQSTQLLDGNHIRQILSDPKILSKKRFLSLKSGFLKIVFQDDKDATTDVAFTNFRKYLSNNENYIDEDMLWDYITAPNVITRSGFNLFILECMSDRDLGHKREYVGQIVSKNPFNNITIKCPIGYEVEDLYDLSKPSIVLLKYHSYYEPIYYVHDDWSQQRLFEPHHEKIVEIYGMLNQCKPEIDKAVYENLLTEKVLTDRVDPEVTALMNVEKQATLKTTLNSLKLVSKITAPTTEIKSFQPFAQIIDKYNKAVYIVIKNDIGKVLKLPVKPSSRISDKDIITELYGTFLPLDYYDTIHYLTQLNNIMQLSINPIANILDWKEENVIGLLLENGLAVEIEHIKLADISKEKLGIYGYSDLDNTTIYYDSRYMVDRSIAQLDKEEIPDLRVQYVKQRKFEDESYQRLRYELSNLLQKAEYHNVLTTIKSIIKMTKKQVEGTGTEVIVGMSEKRQMLIDVLTEPLHQIVTKQRSEPFDYNKYIRPNVRTRCRSKTQNLCQKDPHCTMDSDSKQCKLFIEPSNLVAKMITNTLVDNFERYLALIVEELLKDRLKRKELLNNQVDTSVDETTFEYRNSELILKEASFQEHIDGVDNLYKKGIDYYERMSKIYDMSNPINIRDDPDKSIVALSFGKVSKTQYPGFEPLDSIYWEVNMKEDFMRRTDKGTTNGILESLTLALNQRDNKVYTISTIREKLAEQIANIVDDDKTGEKGWQLLLKHYQDPVRGEKLSAITTLNELQTYVRSDRHQIFLVDLIMISQIYNVKFIILSSNRAPYNPLGVICMGITTTIADSYILLYEIALERYQILARMDKLGPKYVFSSHELPTKLYHQWRACCQMDITDKSEKITPSIFSYPMLLPKSTICQTIPDIPSEPVSIHKPSKITFKPGIGMPEIVKIVPEVPKIQKEPKISGPELKVSRPSGPSGPSGPSTKPEIAIKHVTPTAIKPEVKSAITLKPKIEIKPKIPEPATRPILTPEEPVPVLKPEVKLPIFKPKITFKQPAKPDVPRIKSISQVEPELSKPHVKPEAPKPQIKPEALKVATPGKLKGPTFKPGITFEQPAKPDIPRVKSIPQVEPKTPKPQVKPETPKVATPGKLKGPTFKPSMVPSIKIQRKDEDEPV